MNKGDRKSSVITWVIVILCIVGLSSCDFLSLFTSRDQYFYSMGMGDSSGSSNYSLPYRKDGYELIMSRGQGGTKLTQAEAQTLQASTSFTVTLDSVNITANGPTTVDELGDDGWHVVQSFDLSNTQLSKGVHTLIGITVGIRTNTVNLTIE